MCAFFPFFSRVFFFNFYCAYLYFLPFLFFKPFPVLLFRLVTWAFSPNVNPNRLSTEGYCSSSQKRRQIFRYWGAADSLVCCHAHFLKVVWWWHWWTVVIIIFAWCTGLINGYISIAPWMHGCFVVSLGTDLLTHQSFHHQLHFNGKYPHQFHSDLLVLWLI